MQVEALRSERESPEALVGRLARQLRQHGLWDLLLIFLPPLLAGTYCLASLYRIGWMSAAASVAAVFAATGLSSIAVVGFLRRQAPPLRVAAGLVDERAGADDRFITLSTIEPAAAPPSMVSRLRAEARVFLDRIQLSRDFPYRVKRSFYWSFFASLALALLFRLVLPLVYSSINPASAPERLRELAARMAERPTLAELARQFQALATKVENPKNSEQETQAAVQELQKNIAQEQSRQGQNDQDRDLLSEAASTLKEMDQQTGEGQQQEQGQNRGGGELQSNVPQEGKQKTSPSSEGGDAEGESDAQPNKDIQSGQASQGEPKEQAKGEAQQKRQEGKRDQADPNDSGREKNQELAGKIQGNREDKGGKSKASEEIPQSPPPAERLSRPGEQGNEGIKGARYVTVQLPEEATVEAKGERGGTTDAKGNRVGQKLPASNVPLPAHLPDAANEKQHVPLEYRGMIR
jgi:hypothetical protein